MDQDWLNRTSSSFAGAVCEPAYFFATGVSEIQQTLVTFKSCNNKRRAGDSPRTWPGIALA
jgi:hypothetical protein